MFSRRTVLMASVAALLAQGPLVHAQSEFGFDPWYVQNPYGSDRTIELADGGKLVWRRDGRMVHYDAAGKPIEMKDGVTMKTKDGTTLLMSNRTLWQTLGSALKPVAAGK
jgi:hypothetical protein